MTLSLAYESEFYAADAALEGYNWDKKAEYKEIKERARTLCKEARAAAKAGDVEKTKKTMDQLIGTMQEDKRKFDAACKEEGGVISSVIGLFAYSFRVYGFTLLSVITAYPTFGMSIFVTELKAGLDQLVTIIEAIGHISRGDFTASDLNVYTKALSHNMSIIIEYYKKVSQRLVKKAEKRSAKASESWMFD